MLKASWIITLNSDYSVSPGHVGPPLPCNSVKLVDVAEMNYLAANGEGEVREFCRLSNNKSPAKTKNKKNKCILLTSAVNLMLKNNYKHKEPYCCIWMNTSSVAYSETPYLYFPSLKIICMSGRFTEKNQTKSDRSRQTMNILHDNAVRVEKTHLNVEGNKEGRYNHDKLN